MMQGIGQFQQGREANLFLNILSDYAAQQIGVTGGAAIASGAPQLIQSIISNPEGVFQQIGEMAQLYTLGQAHGPALETILTTLGVDATDLPTTQLFDKLIGMVTGTSSEAGAAAGAGLSSGASSAMGALGAAYSAYNLISNFGHMTPMAGATNGAALGAYVGTSILPGIGTGVGAIIGGIAGGIAGLFHNGKHKDQVARDAVRTQLQQIGLVDKDYQLTLADGSKFNIGVDGGHKFTNLDGTERRVYNTDGSNPLTGEVIGWAQPLAFLLTGGNKKLKDDFTGYFVNAALSNAGADIEVARKNIAGLFAQLQITPEQVLQGLQQGVAQGALTENEFMAFAHGIETLLNGTTSNNRPTAEFKPQALIPAGPVPEEQLPMAA